MCTFLSNGSHRIEQYFITMFSQHFYSSTAIGWFTYKQSNSIASSGNCMQMKDLTYGIQCIWVEVVARSACHDSFDFFFLSQFLNRRINVETHYDPLDPFEYVHPLIVKTHWHRKIVQNNEIVTPPKATTIHAHKQNINFVSHIHFPITV